MFTIVDNKPYLIENNKMFPINVSLEKGVEKAGKEEKLPANYPIYTLREIQIKYGVEKEKAYYFDKEKYEKDLAEAKEQKEAEEKERLKEELKKELEEAKENTPTNDNNKPATNNNTKNN